MYFCIVDFATPGYDQIIDLRTQVLRTPLGLEFYVEDIEKEYDLFHLAAYDNNDNLLATLILHPQQNGEIKMRQVAVNPQLQKSGIGTKLVKYSEAYSKDLGFNNMTMHARESAIPFYERLGYSKVGKRFKEVGIDHFKLTKSL